MNFHSRSHKWWLDHPGLIIEAFYYVLIVDARFMKLSVVDIAPWDLPPYQKLNAWFDVVGGSKATMGESQLPPRSPLF